MELRTKRGELTCYAFACGYPERNGPFRLYMEHGVYHVAGHTTDGVWIHRSDKTMTQARKTLREVVRIYK